MHICIVHNVIITIHLIKNNNNFIILIDAKNDGIFKLFYNNILF